MAFPEMSLAIDLGVCTSAALRCDTIALTHTHADHLAGIHTYLAVRRLYGMKSPRIVAPSVLVDRLDQFLVAMGNVQGRPFEYTLVGADLGDEIDIGRGLLLKPFAVEHTMPSLGFAVIRRVKKLRAAYLGLPGDEIARRKREPGHDLFETVDESLIAVTGDTTASGIDLSAGFVRNSRVLFLEATFLDGRRDADAARLGAHTHLDELLPLITGIEAGAIVLYHFSQVYGAAEIETIMGARLPAELEGRVHLLLPEEGDRL
jgi:ribonuclease Z